MKRPKDPQHSFYAEMKVLVNRRIHPDMTPERLKEIVDGITQSGKIPDGIKVVRFKRGYHKGKLHDKTEAFNSGHWTSDTVGGFITDARQTNPQNRKG